MFEIFETMYVEYLPDSRNVLFYFLMYDCTLIVLSEDQVSSHIRYTDIVVGCSSPID